MAQPRTKSEKYPTISVCSDVHDTLQGLKRREEGRVGVKLSWTQFFRVWLKGKGGK
jgi:hypothetical protein